MGKSCEYHTFGFDGPLFLKRIKLACVEIIKLETTKKLEFNIQQLIDREK